MTDLTVTRQESIADRHENQWNTLVSQSDLGSVFHRSGWLRAVERGLDRRVAHLVGRKGSNPVAIFPNFRVSIDLPDPSTQADHVPTDALVTRPGLR